MNQVIPQRISGTLHLNKHRPPVSAGGADTADEVHDEVDAQKRVDLTHAGRADQPALPHERDEQVGMTGGVSSPVVQQAARDLKRGIKDTSRAVESNVAYEKLKHA